MNNPLLSCDCGNPDCPTPFYQGMEAAAELMGFDKAKLVDMLIQWVCYTLKGDAPLIVERVEYSCKLVHEFNTKYQEPENENTH